ncbi:MAG TPA: transketolase C-terminal domain-containing protein [Chloroflexota bacterium]|nr:transketolase C-terminal domain-containing protein [Chloroflexota bacterium]
MTELLYVPAAELERIRALGIDPVERAAIFAAACRINALYMIGKAGSGHLGTTFSSMDIVAWLHLEELRLSDDRRVPIDRYFSSKGHDVPALYAVMIGLGRLPFESIHTLRRLDGLPGHPDVGTPGITANTGSLGMGISKAKGFALANRLQGRAGEVYVLTGDGELQEGQFWESLGSAANQRLEEITVIVDHNKVQSDTLVERVSSLGDLEGKLRAFGWAVARCDGHDLHDFRRALGAVRAERGKPKIIVADTIKGKGVSFAEHTAMAPTDRLYKFHSGAPAPDVHERMAEELVATANRLLREAGAAELALERRPFPERPALGEVQRMVPVYAKTLVECAADDPRIVALDGDLVLDTGLLEFEERFADRFVECGIAEQDMVSQASGLALAGMLPVCHSFACFLSTRPNEQIYNQATEKTKVVYVGSLAGLVPGGPGHSHQSVRDIATLASVPNMELIEPSCEAETALATRYALTESGQSVYLRLVSIPCSVPYTLPDDYEFVVGRGVALTEGDDAVLIGYGPVLLPQAFEAARLLRERGIGLKVVNLSWLNRIDSQWLRETVDGYRVLVTLDNHYVWGGQGEWLVCQVARLGLASPPRAVPLGVREIPACGTNDEVLRYHGLDAESLADTIASSLGAPAIRR